MVNGTACLPDPGFISPACLSRTFAPSPSRSHCPAASPSEPVEGVRASVSTSTSTPAAGYGFPSGPPPELRPSPRSRSRSEPRPGSRSPSRSVLRSRSGTAPPLVTSLSCPGSDEPGLQPSSYQPRWRASGSSGSLFPRSESVPVQPDSPRTTQPLSSHSSSEPLSEEVPQALGSLPGATPSQSPTLVNVLATAVCPSPTFSARLSGPPRIGYGPAHVGPVPKLWPPEDHGSSGGDHAFRQNQLGFPDRPSSGEERDRDTGDGGAEGGNRGNDPTSFRREIDRVRTPFASRGPCAAAQVLSEGLQPLLQQLHVFANRHLRCAFWPGAHVPLFFLRYAGASLALPTLVSGVFLGTEEAVLQLRSRIPCARIPLRMLWSSAERFMLDCGIPDAPWIAVPLPFQARSPTALPASMEPTKRASKSLPTPFLDAPVTLSTNRIRSRGGPGCICKR